MDLLFCFDQNYEQHFGVALTSFLLNNPDVPVTAHLLTKEKSRNLDERFKSLEDEFNVTIVVYEVSDENLTDFPLSSHFSTAIYYRLIAPELLPQSLDRILYLDSDVVVTGSVTELYSLDFCDKVVAACGSRVITTKQRLQLQGNYYFNSGVILINLVQWRRQEIGRQCLEFLNRCGDEVKFGDQDALNKVIDGDFVSVDRRWNTLVDFYSGRVPVTAESVILHFIGGLKPWQVWCIEPERQFYWSYLRRSPWRDAWPEFPKTLKKTASALRAILRQLKRRFS